MNGGHFVDEATIELLLLVQTGQLDFLPFAECCDNRLGPAAWHELGEGSLKLPAVDREPFPCVRRGRGCEGGSIEPSLVFAFRNKVWYC